jgi:NTE family protein
MRSFAHIGVLQEFNRQGIPLQAVVGIETGALVGAIYSLKAQPFDVEWQMSKIKEEVFFKRSFMGKQTQDVTALQSFLNEYFSSQKFEDTKVNFSCPSFLLSKKQTLMINKGSLNSGLLFCMPFPPLFKPYQNSTAAVQALNSSVQYLRSKQVEMILYVSLLDDKPGSYISPAESDHNLMWNFVSQSLENQYSSAQQVIHVPLQGFELTAFDKRNQMIQKGREAAQAFLTELKKQWEF